MAEHLALDNFALLPQGKTLSLSLMPGQSMAICGPAASGKTSFLRAIAGSDRPAQGSAQALTSLSVAGKGEFARKSSPQSLAKKAVGKRKLAHAAEAMTAAKLFDFRDQPLGNLSSSQVAACELLPCLCGEGKLLLVDGQLDRLDPWTLHSVMSFLRKRLALGCSLVAVTNRPELVHQFDYLVVLQAKRLGYAGTVEGLIQKGPKCDLKVDTNSQQGVRALVDPLNVRVSKAEGGLMLQTDKGQEVAAKLLLEGYGDVNYIVLHEPTVEQCLLALK